MTRGDVGPKLTVRDRILVHLAEHASEDKEYEVAPEVTREGLAAAVDIEPKHVPQYLRPLVAEGFVSERAGRVTGGRRRLKAYVLTPRGRTEAALLRGKLLEIPVDVEIGGERRSMILRDALKEHFRGVPLLSVLEISTSRGFLPASGNFRTAAGPSPTDALQLPAVRVALEKATDLEKKYNWSGAIEDLEAAKAQIPRDEAGASGVVLERLAYARYRAAFQSDSPAEFRKRMQRALDAYQEALATHRVLGGGGKPRSLRCDAMITYAHLWLASGMSERKRLLAEFIRQRWETLRAFEANDEPVEFGRTYNQLTLDTMWGQLVFDRAVWKKNAAERVEDGERAVRFLVGAHDPNELARAYTNAAWALRGYGGFVADDLVERQRCLDAALNFWQKARECSEDTADLTLVEPFMGDGTEQSLAFSNRRVQLAAATGDRFLAGRAARNLAYQLWWKHLLAENPIEAAQILERAAQSAAEAKRQFDTLGVPAPAQGSYAPETYVSEHYFSLAGLETDPSKKRALLEKARRAALAELVHAQGLEHERLEAAVRFDLPDICQALARLETRREPKKRLLQEAELHAKASVDFAERAEVPWNLAEAYAISAEVAAGLAALTDEPQARERALRAAISDMDTAFRLWIKEQEFYDRLGEIAGYKEIGGKQYEAGEFLLRLWDITRDPEDLRRAARTFGEAASSYARVDTKSRMAECYWKMGEVHDSLGDYRKSAHHFRLASESYELAAGKVPQLQELYKDHGLYMSAWNEIEGARYHHMREEYGKAQEFYEKAANLHRFTRRWSSFAPNYAAWAALEKAEDLSRTERTAEAIQSFQTAAELFAEARKSLEATVPTFEDHEQRNLAEQLVNATEPRGRYCRARAVLEEAKILEKQGDDSGSSDRYGDAADMFDEIARSLSDERDRHEIKLVMTFARAWQVMARAAAHTSVELYAEAARLFEEAKELSPTEAGKLLATAHSHFCEALAAGADFSQTQDGDRHDAAVRHLETAADYYEKMGLSSAVQHAKASRLLFDGYVYLDRADRETDPAGKAKHYSMTERVLRASADAYAQAEQIGKEKEVLRLLGRVKGQQDLAVSLSDILRAPAIASATTSFPTPTPTHERPVGLDRFEHADIQANLLVGESTVAIGQTFELEIEMVNAGRGAAQLVKVEELGLQHFEPINVRGPWAFAEGYVDMKGKRVDPLGTTELKILMSPREHGRFRLRPRILYLDDLGRYRAHEPDPVEIDVTETAP